MAKIAQLHDGTEIHFPDNTPDEHMDMMVQNHVGSAMPVDSAQSMPEVVALLTHFLLTFNKSQKDAVMQEGVSARMLTQAQLQSSESEVAAIGQASERVGQYLVHSMDALGGQLQTLAANTANIPKLISAVDKLAAAIVQTGDTIRQTLLLPAIVHRDKAGNMDYIAKKG